jgi:hypothetical protein
MCDLLSSYLVQLIQRTRSLHYCLNQDLRLVKRRARYLTEEKDIEGYSMKEAGKRVEEEIAWNEE